MVRGAEGQKQGKGVHSVSAALMSLSLTPVQSTAIAVLAAQ